MKYVVASETPYGRKYLNVAQLVWGNAKDANHYQEKRDADRALSEVNEKIPALLACRFVSEVHQ